MVIVMFALGKRDRILLTSIHCKLIVMTFASCPWHLLSSSTELDGEVRAQKRTQVVLRPFGAKKETKLTPRLSGTVICRLEELPRGSISTTTKTNRP